MPGKPFPSTQLHHLLYYLDPATERNWRVDLDTFEQRLQRARKTVKAQGKTKPYKKVFNQLIANHADNVHSAIFEVSVVSALLATFHNTKLYPSFGKRDVEACIQIGSNDIYLDCKARGYSGKVDHREGAINPGLAPEKFIQATLLKKYCNGEPLLELAQDHPTLLFTCIGFDGFDANYSYYKDAIETTLPETPCSAVFVFDRYICRWFSVFINSHSTYPLPDEEIQAVIDSMKENLSAEHRMTHYAA